MLSFSQMEAVLGFSLPNSACKFQQWWENGGHSHSYAWMDAGFVVIEVSLTMEWVIFGKDDTAKAASPRVNVSASAQMGRKNTGQDGAIRRQTNDVITINVYRFVFLQELIPECDGAGRIKEYQP